MEWRCVFTLDIVKIEAVKEKGVTYITLISQAKKQSKAKTEINQSGPATMPMFMYLPDPQQIPFILVSINPDHIIHNFSPAQTQLPSPLEPSPRTRRNPLRLSTHDGT